VKHGTRKKCPQCGLEGHSTPACHVAARGSAFADQYDARAQELVPTPGPSEHVRVRDVRALVARLLRSGGRP
jgi:hypothetical protein